jgi:serine/threonine protein kinase
MGETLSDELVDRGVASRRQLEEAKRNLAVSGGRLVDQLIDAGCVPDALISALSAVTGLPEAPRSALRAPASLGLSVRSDELWDANAAPFGVDAGGRVRVAISDPASRGQLAALGLSGAVVELAPPALVRTCLLLAFPELSRRLQLDEEDVATLSGGVRMSLGARSAERATAAINKLPASATDEDFGSTHPTAAQAGGNLRFSGNVTAGSLGLSLPLVDADEIDDRDNSCDGPTQLVAGLSVSHGGSLNDVLPTQAQEPAIKARLAELAEEAMPTVATGLKALRGELDTAGAFAAEADGFDEYDVNLKTVAMSALEMAEAIAPGALAKGARVRVEAPWSEEASPRPSMEVSAEREAPWKAEDDFDESMLAATVEVERLPAAPPLRAPPKVVADDDATVVSGSSPVSPGLPPPAARPPPSLLQDSDEPTQVSGFGPASATRVASAGRPPVDVGELPIASVARLAPRQEAHKQQGVDTSPTGPIAVRGYDIKEVLGAGGMATVYRAFQRSADREVALKILSPHLAGDEAFVARFQREIRSCAALTHPNIVRIFDYGDEAGMHFMATEVMDRGSLRDALIEHGKLPVPIALKFMEHLLRGVGHAHKQGMVHRDLKPANLLLSSEGALKLADFGIAKSETDETLTRAGALFGTPAYMSPEQAFGRAIDSRSDLFSCGTIFYELLTGESPYQADTAAAALLRVSRANPVPALLSCPAAPPLLLDVLARLQTRDTEARWQTAEDALVALHPLLEAIDRHWPDLVRRFTEDPKRTMAQVNQEHAALELERARFFLAEQPPAAFAAATATYLASVLDEKSAPARALLDKLSQHHGFFFGESTDARVHDAERARLEDPRAPGLLRRLSDLYRASGNPFAAGLWLREYLAVRPQDSHASMQLGHLLGASPLAGFDTWQRRAAPEEELNDNDDDELFATEAKPAAMPEDAQVPPRPVQKAPSPLASPPPARAAPVPPPPLEENVRSALRTHDPSEMLRAATQRARGLQVLRPGDSSKVQPAAPGMSPAAAPLVSLPTPGPPPAPASERRRSFVPLVAAALGALLFLVAAGGVAGWFLLSRRAPPAVLAADPGAERPLQERQRALVGFARARLGEGEGVLALAAAERVLGLDGQTQEAAEALVLRGRAHASVGDSAAAGADFRAVMGRYPADNLLHLEAKRRLGELAPPAPSR